MAPYDVVIIGGSAAGVSAAVYAKRRNLNFALVSQDIGGEVALSGEIENYVGFPHTDGLELTDKFKEQLKYNDITYTEASVEKIEKSDTLFSLKAKQGENPLSFRAKAVIIATGGHPRTLNVPGEKEFKSKGVTYCTTCDGPLFGGKVTATIGGGNSGLESVLMMEQIASHAYLLQHADRLKGDDVLMKKVASSPKITVLLNAETKEITGDTFAKQLKYIDKATSEEKMLDVQGIFIHIGMIPNAQFIDFVDKDPAGHIKVDTKCVTNVPGIFAAGDVTDVAYKQISIAVGQGTIAALAAVEYLNKLQ